MSAPPTRARHTVVAFTLALVAVSYLDRICISTTAPAIKADLGLSDAEMGFVFSAFTFAYAVFEIPSGWFADRFGARLTLTRIVVGDDCGDRPDSGLPLTRDRTPAVRAR
jgi:MFS family permease